MADVLAWMVSVANLLGIDLQTEVLEKYPRVSPVFFQSMHLSAPVTENT
jgi:hypothetical protein